MRPCPGSVGNQQWWCIRLQIPKVPFGKGRDVSGAVGGTYSGFLLWSCQNWPRVCADTSVRKCLCPTETWASELEAHTYSGPWTETPWKLRECDKLELWRTTCSSNSSSADFPNCERTGPSSQDFPSYNLRQSQRNHTLMYAKQTSQLSAVENHAVNTGSF